MKANKKTYINIANLGITFSIIVNQHQSSKKETKRQYTFRNRPLSQQNVYEHVGVEGKVQKENLYNTINVNRRVSLKLDFNESMEKDNSGFQKTKRTSPTCQTVKEKIQKDNNYENTHKFKELQNMMVSDKMFIDPDRWQNFLQRSKKDPKFHKALSAFLYSYFIQNYQ